MKFVVLMLTFLITVPAFAHEGHGEMPTEAAKYGGSLGNVVSETKLLKKEKHNPPLMKAEIVRSEDGTVRVYVYDLKMKQLALEGYSKEAKGVVENEKTKTSEKFSLTLEGNQYKGTYPKQKRRPFNVYVTFMKGAEKYFVGFDNLD